MKTILLLAAFFASVPLISSAQEPEKKNAEAVKAATTPPGKIAFMRAGKVWIIDADGKNERALTAELMHKSNRSLAWSPDGKRLLYTCYSEVGRDIWSMDADGKNAINLTNTKKGGDCTVPAWSPDGKRIAFMGCLSDDADNLDPVGLHVMDADGKNLKRLSSWGITYYPMSWSPDGKRIAYWKYANGGEYRIIDVDGKNDTMFANNASAPFWSRDGKSICFVRLRKGWKGFNNLCRADTDGMNEITIAHRLSWRSEPIPSPDGKQIAFVTGKKRHELCVVDADGKNTRKLVNLYTHSDGDYCWSPDGKWIAYTCGPLLHEEIHVVELSSLKNSKLTDGGALYPAWQPAQ